ncbi:hypothetical protein [Parageobacillus toebii]|uniref:hypothetical protein n=1 Tax=Parageobacillus toebii TaxID=153151 RepID=UPI0035B503D5
MKRTDLHPLPTAGGGCYRRSFCENIETNVEQFQAEVRNRLLHVKGAIEQIRSQE